MDREAMQQAIKEEGKIIVLPTEVRHSVDPELERWELAAESELSKNFVDMNAVRISTPDEIRR